MLKKLKKLSNEKRLIKVIRKADYLKCVGFDDYVGRHCSRNVVLNLVWSDNSISEKMVFIETTYKPDEVSDFPVNAEEIIELSLYANKQLIGKTEHEIKFIIEYAKNLFRNSADMNELKVRIEDEKDEWQLKRLAEAKKRRHQREIQRIMGFSE